MEEYYICWHCGYPDSGCECQEPTTGTNQQSTDMKMNSKIVREQVRQHILECVYDEDENQLKDAEHAGNHLLFEFDRVANNPNNQKRIPNHQDRFSDYMMGLPFHFHYNQQDIADYLNGLGLNPEGKEYPSEQSMKIYHYLIWREISS